MRLKIVSDGTAMGTEVLDELGNRIQGVTAIEIGRIEAGGVVTAKIEFEWMELDIKATSE